MSVKIEFVNHSSFLASHGEIGLMCDFWKSGRVFNDGWDLLCDTSFEYDRFSDVTHLWYSHEHPDHFSPADIRRIPEALRAEIVVLFQQTEDHRVADYCRRAGFKDVVELEPYSRFPLSPDCSVTCAPFSARWGDVDSWLLMEMGDRKILNINDCEIHTENHVAPIRDYCGDIDLLTAQFSYASRQGNPGDQQRFSRAHQAHLRYFDSKVSLLKPKWVLPFASFVYWCNKDNRYQNDTVVRVDEIETAVLKQAIAAPLVMYPGDVWRLGDPIENYSALEKYRDDYARVAAMPMHEFVNSESVAEADLRSAATRLMAPLRDPALAGKVRRFVAERHFDAVEADQHSYLKRNLLKIAAVLTGTIHPVLIHVSDLGQSFTLSIDRGLEPIEKPVEECDLSMNSEPLCYYLSNPFGGETLQVNARMVEIARGGLDKLFAVSYLARRLDQNLEVPAAILPTLFRRLGFDS